MVMRYWGNSDVFPQDFAPLVTSADAGIVTTTLVNNIVARGWQAVVLPDAASQGEAPLREALDQGRPVVALVEVAPRTFHYVVVVGITANAVIVHDPARAPYRTWATNDFDRAWSAAGRWAVLILPPISPAHIAPPAARAPAASMPAAAIERPSTCTALVDAAVAVAITGDIASAERGLVAATTLCPSDPAPLRELAGLRFAQSRWREAATVGAQAAQLAPTDTYTWQLVASSHYMAGDRTRALDAWNRVGEPLIDLITIHGLDRTPQPVAMHAAGLEPRHTLTAERLALARRRLRALPIAEYATINYELLDTPPSTPRRATLNIDVRERARFPTGWRALAAIGARAATRREVRVDSGGWLGVGDASHVTWRWMAHRPHVEAVVALPSPGSLPGTLSLAVMGDHQSYATSNGPISESRRGVDVSVGDWVTSARRWRGSVGLDVFNSRDHVTVGGIIEQRVQQDHVLMSVEAHQWWSLSSSRAFSSLTTHASWRSTPSDAGVAAVMIDLTGSTASASAPLALWSGAGTTNTRGALLRAHRLWNDGIITSPAFGRSLFSASIEYTKTITRRGPGALAAAAFVDSARAWRRVTTSHPSTLLVDAGIGLRVNGPAHRGMLRVDLAHGLRGGGTSLSAGWVLPWP